MDKIDQKRDDLVRAACDYVEAEIAFERPRSGNDQADRLNEAGEALRKAVIRYRGRPRKICDRTPVRSM